MDRKFVESLGWTFGSSWANRDVYNLGDFMIIEHNGSWSIANGADWYAIEDTGEEMLTEFTNLIKKLYEIYNNPENHTLAEYFKAGEDIRTFYNKNGYTEEDNLEC